MQLAYLVDKNNEGPVDESESRCCPSDVCSLVSLMHHTTSIDRMHSGDKELIKCIPFIKVLVELMCETP